MKGKSACWLGVWLVILALALLPLVACSMQGARSSFCDAGNSDLDYTGSGGEFAKYSLFRFDTTAASRTLTIPSAADMMGALSSPVVGQVIVFAVAADGGNAVTVNGGTSVTVKPSASAVAGNTTRLIYCVVDSTSSGDEQVTVY